MLFALVGGFLLLAAAAALCFLVAARNQYLLVLGGAKTGAILLERQDGGRYALISPAELPLALLRFAGLVLTLAVLSVWISLRDWVQSLVPSLSRIGA